MTVGWTTTGAVIAALGTPSTPAPDDAWLVACVDAANAAAYRKRQAAGYVDDAGDDAPAPSPDVGMGATLWAVALWRERASTDSFASFEDLSGFTPTGGAWGEIKKMLAVPRAGTDRLPPEAAPALAARRRRRLARLRVIR